MISAAPIVSFANTFSKQDSRSTGKVANCTDYLHSETLSLSVSRECTIYEGDFREQMHTLSFSVLGTLGIA